MKHFEEGEIDKDGHINTSGLKHYNEGATGNDTITPSGLKHYEEGSTPAENQIGISGRNNTFLGKSDADWVSRITTSGRQTTYQGNIGSISSTWVDINPADYPPTESFSTHTINFNVPKKSELYTYVEANIPNVTFVDYPAADDFNVVKEIIYETGSAGYEGGGVSQKTAGISKIKKRAVVYTIDPHPSLHRLKYLGCKLTSTKTFSEVEWDSPSVDTYDLGPVVEITHTNPNVMTVVPNMTNQDSNNNIIVT